MHNIGAITNYIDVAQMVLYAFWLFFAGLVFYLVLENKREGYPLVTRDAGVRLGGIFPMPIEKTFLLRNGETRTVPQIEPEETINAVQMEGFEGAPYVPLGNPMQDGLGPASYAQRSEHPERTMHGEARTVPMRVADDHWVAEEDPDPRGMQVFTVDGLVAGLCVDIWVDRAELMARYIEVEVPDRDRHVVVPMELVRVVTYAIGGVVKVHSVTAGQLAEAPVPVSPDEITSREEDRIQAYFGSGHLYALPSRMGPLL
jgi:photosynthetic reaction center H subunit